MSKAHQRVFWIGLIGVVSILIMYALGSVSGVVAFLGALAIGVVGAYVLDLFVLLACKIHNFLYEL